MSYGRSNRRRALTLQACDPSNLFRVPQALQSVMWGSLMRSIVDDDIGKIQDARHLCEMRIPRTCSTYQYSGAFLDYVDGEHPDPSFKWNSFPLHKKSRRLMHNLRMQEADFDALYELVEPHLQHREPIQDAGRMRSCSKRHQLLATLDFVSTLSDAESLRRKVWVATLELVCVLFTALRTALFTDHKSPGDEAGKKGLANGFQQRCNLPGCVGAIDGTFIPQSKPT
jgi:hypothetical protein